MSDVGATAPAGGGVPKGWDGTDLFVFLITLMFLLWPLAVNRAPFYSDDSPSYLRGGEFGITTGLLMIENWWHSLVGTASEFNAAPISEHPRRMVAAAVAQSGGARSLVYSVATGLLRAPGISLAALAVFQAVAVALVISILRRAVTPRSGLAAGTALAAGVASLTAAPWYASSAMPDIWAGIAIGGALALTVYYDRPTSIERVILVALVAFAVAAHGSHLPVALSVLIAGAAAHIWLHRPAPASAAKRIAWFVSPVALAVAAMLASSYLAFGEASLAPKRYPILLARSVADGPGAWYLRRHCATERYAICELFGTKPPRKVGEFLWSPNGVRYRATPDQMERIRAEESLIVRRAALEYPLHQVRRFIVNTFAQFFEFGLNGVRFGTVLVGSDDPMMVQARPDWPHFRGLAEAVIYVSFSASVLVLLALRQRLRRIEVAALTVAVVGLLANAAVCGTLSAVTDRYQGRVAWILPLFAMIIMIRVIRRRKGEPDESFTEGT